MKILGISAYFHDSAATIIEDGIVLASAREEAFTRVKHDAEFPTRAIEFCLAQANVTKGELDYVAYFEQPEVKFSRVLSSCVEHFPHAILGSAQTLRSWLLRKLWIRQRIISTVRINPNRIIAVPHHVAHAMTAFNCSTSQKAAILTIDAVGEWTTTGIYKASRDPFHLESLREWNYPNSLGLFYSSFTAFLGFTPLSGEANTMALAAFGRPLFTDRIKQVLNISDDGSFHLDASFFNLLGDHRALFSAKFKKLFGEPRTQTKSLAFNCLSGIQRVDENDQYYADIAASVQLTFEQALLGLAKLASRLTGLSTICYGGGAAMNAVANGRLCEAGFLEIAIPVDPGDGGAALGAALYVVAEKEKSGLKPSNAPYLGPSPNSQLVEQLLPTLRPTDWNEYLKPNVPRKSLPLEWRVLTDDELINLVASALSEGKIIGWIRGRAEYGPRALGARSLLASPQLLPTIERLRRQVKERAAFRPFALSMTKNAADGIFDTIAFSGASLENMHSTAMVRDKFKLALRGGLHVDGSTRVQLVSPETNAMFHKLLQRFGEIVGVEALVNTSFNDTGYPISATGVEGLIHFARTSLDILVVDNILITYQTTS